jgi:hypothetical protein
MRPAQDPSYILEVGAGYWKSKVLLTAVGLGVFTLLGHREMTGEELGKALGLHPRGIWDFFDALVALGFLHREGDGPAGRYRNTPTATRSLDKSSPAYIGGILEMWEDRSYKFWGDLGQALKTGEPQNEIKHNQRPIFEVLYEDQSKLEQFVAAMAGISRGNFQAFAEKFDFSRYKTLCDVGGASGQLSVPVARQHPHMNCTSFDLPQVEPIARRAIERGASWPDSSGVRRLFQRFVASGGRHHDGDDSARLESREENASYSPCRRTAHSSRLRT